jgi:Cu+-exporting ATPase
MTCASCALLIEMKLKRDPRVRSVAVNFASATATVHGVIDRDGVFGVVRRLGYEPAADGHAFPAPPAGRARKGAGRRGQKALCPGRLLTVPVMVSGMLMHRSPALRVMEFALSSRHPVRQQQQHFPKAWTLAKQGEANMDTLIAIGAGAAWAYSIPGVLRMHHHVYFESAAGICTFVLLGRYMEERAKGKAGEAIRKLIELQPETALRLAADGSEQEVPIRRGASRRPSARPGRRQGADRWPCSMAAPAVDEAMITGESLPVAKSRRRRRDRRLPERQRQLHHDRHGDRRRHRAVRHRQTGRSGAGQQIAGTKLADRISARFRPGGRRRCGADLCRLGCSAATRCHAPWRIPWPCC